MEKHNPPIVITRYVRAAVWACLLALTAWLGGEARAELPENTSSTSSSSSSSSSRTSTSSSSSSSSSSRSSSSSSKKSRSRRDKDTPKVDEKKTEKGTPARARAQDRSATPKGPGGKGSRSGGQAEAPLAKLNLPANLQENTVYFMPTRLETIQGDSFSSSLVFYNNLEAKVDALDLWVQFDPALVSLEWADTDPLAAFAPQDLKVQQWAEEGYIHLACKLGSPVMAKITPLCELHWRAQRTTAQTSLTLKGPEGKTVALLEGERNVIAPSKIGNQARVSMQLTIRPGARSEDDFGLRLVEDERQWMVPGQQDKPGPQSLRLALEPAAPAVATGQVSTLDVVLLNPQGLVFDQLKFQVRYDPRTIEILDADQENYITQGLNIYDGGFHQNFPFEYHGANSVDPSTGLIRYEVGDTTGGRPYASATVARIVYRMKRQAGKAKFWFERMDPSTGLIATDIMAQGASLLPSDPAQAAQVLHGAIIQVAPLKLK